MAALTWRDVAPPSFSGSGESLRASNAQLGSALAGISEGLKQFGAQQQKSTDDAFLGRAYRIQSPQEMREFLQTQDLAGVSPKVLQQLDQRVGSLLSQNATEQSIASSKLGDQRTQQTIDNTNYSQNRQVRDDQFADAARADAAQLFGSKGNIANLSLEDQAKNASMLSQLQTAALGRASTQRDIRQKDFNYGTGVRDDNARQSALALEGQLLRDNASQTDLLQGYEDVDGQNPQTMALLRERLEKATGSSLYGQAGGSGGKSGAKAEDPPLPAIANEALAENARRVAQNSSVGVVADIEKNMADTRSAPEIANDIAKLVPKANIGDITGIIRKAMSDNPNLSAADAGSALQRSLRDNGWFTPGVRGVGDGIGVDTGSFEANLKTLVDGKADYASAGNRETRAVGEAIRSAGSRLAKAQQDLQRIQTERPNADDRNAEFKVDAAQRALDAAIAKQQEDERFLPIYTKDPIPVPPKPLRRDDPRILR